MSKKSQKSLFAWCIRTLAVSLVPTLLLVSCATDSDGDKTDPTATFDATNDLTVTFSEAVQGVSASNASGTCAGTVQLADSDGTCYAVTISVNDKSYTVNPASTLAAGTYTLTLTSGITDSAGNQLAQQIFTFTVGVEASLEAALTGGLTGITDADKITEAALKAVTANSSISDAIPAAIGGAFDYILAQDTPDTNAMAAVTEALIGAIDGVTATSRGLRSTALTIDELNAILSSVILIIVEKAPDAAAMKSITTGMTKGAGKAVTDANQLTSETGVLASISKVLVTTIAASSRTDKAEALSPG